MNSLNQSILNERGNALRFNATKGCATILVRVIVVLGIVGLMTGCAAPSLVGPSPSATPPKLVLVADKNQQGKEILTWDRPLAFGPVPPYLKAVGDVSCLRARVDLEAIGYHPGAIDQSGKPMPSGGFFCGPKSHGSEPGKIAPQLIRQEGVLGWDRPSAFGAVPKEQEARGKQVCSSVGKGFEAIGYHPQANDESGKQIPGGAFFCALAVAK